MTNPIELIEHVMQKPPPAAHEHAESGDCWCHPTLDYTNPETGAQHWVHHEPN